jgi:hypothetical protein
MNEFGPNVLLAVAGGVLEAGGVLLVIGFGEVIGFPSAGGD